MRQVKDQYPAIPKHPALLPVIWVVRWGNLLLFRHRTIRERVRILRSLDDNKVLDKTKALEAVGLGYHFRDKK